ncbi:hypothetical protein ND991_17990 [Gordonia sputi]|uniref:hypothetical protein n=1 Tax=Gordonia sputi TaxID=36823 RepID=UPI002042E552|nr:hypothetical protein [Gordonia sputi]MCM3897100.1 hypothetical protein [Gordonia sputi]
MGPERLAERQIVPLTADELARLQEGAQSAAMTAGLFSRALIAYALSRLTDADMQKALEDARAATAARISAGAQVAAARRWGK